MTRINYEDEYQKRGQMDLSKVNPGDKVRLTAEHSYPDDSGEFQYIVKEGEMAVVEHTDDNSLVVTAITQFTGSGSSKPKTFIVDPSKVVLLTTTDDSRIGNNRIGLNYEEEMRPPRVNIEDLIAQGVSLDTIVKPVGLGFEPRPLRDFVASKREAGWWQMNETGGIAADSGTLGEGGLANEIPGEHSSDQTLMGDGPADIMGIAVDLISEQYQQAWERGPTKEELIGAIDFVTGPDEYWDGDHYVKIPDPESPSSGEFLDWWAQQHEGQVVDKTIQARLDIDGINIAKPIMGVVDHQCPHCDEVIHERFGSRFSQDKRAFECVKCGGVFRYKSLNEMDRQNAEFTRMWDLDREAKLSTDDNIKAIAEMEQDADLDKEGIDLAEMEDVVKRLYDRGVLITDPEAVASGIRSYMVELMRQPEEEQAIIPILRNMFRLVKNTTPENWQEFVAGTALPPVAVDQMLEGLPSVREHPESFMSDPQPEISTQPESVGPGIPMQEEPLPAPPEVPSLAETPELAVEELPPPESTEEPAGPPDIVRVKTPKGKGKETASAMVGDEVYSQMVRAKGVGIIKDILSPDEVVLELVNRRTKEPLPSKPDKPNPTTVPVDQLWHSTGGSRWSSKVSAFEVMVVEALREKLSKLGAAWEEAGKLGHELSVDQTFSPAYHGGQLTLDPDDREIYVFKGAHAPELDSHYDVPNPFMPNPEADDQDVTNARIRLEPLGGGETIYVTFDEFTNNLRSEAFVNEEEDLRQEQQQLEQYRERLQRSEPQAPVGPDPDVSGEEPTRMIQPFPTGFQTDEVVTPGGDTRVIRPR